MHHRSAIAAALTAALFILAPLCATRAEADENLWGYVYGTDTLPAGQNEIYLWTTSRNQKGEGNYRAWDTSLELEHGFTDNFQASFYVNGRSHQISGGALDDDPDRKLHRGLEWNGVNLELKYNLLSVYKDLFGLSLYIEPAYSRIDKISGERMDGFSLESKLILQKNFFDDQLALAYNLSLEPEWNKFKASGEREKELEFEQSAGISYRFLPHWFTGIEGRYASIYPDFKHREANAYFLGPNIHYAAERWWFTFTFLPQISGNPRISGRDSGGLHLGEYERYEYRFKIAFNF